MSNLRSFLEAKKHCPICGKTLNLSFSNKSKVWKIPDEIPQEIIFPLPLKNFKFSKKQYAYQPIYYFNVDNNTVSIDFIDVVKNIIQSEVSVSILAMTKDYFNNKKDFCFYKGCSEGHYKASTGYFTIIKDKLSKGLSIQNEYVNIVVSNRAVYLYNDFLSQKASMHVDSYYQTDLPLLYLNNKEDIALSVKTLLTFS